MDEKWKLPEGDEEIKVATADEEKHDDLLHGNGCRTFGYRGYHEAVERARAKAKEENGGRGR